MSHISQAKKYTSLLVGIEYFSSFMQRSCIVGEICLDVTADRVAVPI